MAERSKAPDSRFTFSANNRVTREFWSSYEGVGSNPTSDKILFSSLLQLSFLSFFSSAIFTHLSAVLCSFHDVVSIDERDGLPSFFAVAKKKLAQAEQLRSSLFSFFFLGNGWR